MAQLDNLRDPVHLFFQECHPPSFNAVLYLLAMKIVADLLCPCAFCSYWPQAWAQPGGGLHCTCPHVGKSKPQTSRRGNRAKAPSRGEEIPCIKCAEERFIYFALPTAKGSVQDQYNLNIVDWNQLCRPNQPDHPLVNSQGQAVCALPAASSKNALASIIKEVVPFVRHTPEGSSSSQPVFTDQDKIPNPHIFRDFMRTFLGTLLSANGQMAAETCRRAAGHTVKQQGQVLIYLSCDPHVDPVTHPGREMTVVMLAQNATYNTPALVDLHVCYWTVCE